ncbi:MAG: Cu(I)/Ag(I) efflux system membrane protein CusA/SilA [Myxococcota bacterium]
MNAVIRAGVNNPVGVLVAVGFICVLGYMAVVATPVDAIPDISENQTIVFTRWAGHSPQDVENHITRPLSSALRGLAGVREVRGLSGFGFSQVFVVFDDDVEFYWARTRVSEQLQTVRDLPKGVEPALGPDATPLGQILWYSLDAPGLDLATQRSLQDWVIRDALEAVPGVSEVAGIGGFIRQYQVDVDPDKLRLWKLGIGEVAQAIRQANSDVGAKTIERSGMELVVRGIGNLDGIEAVRSILVATRDDVPIFLRHIARVGVGPDFRRGALADEHGERVGGVVTMRQGENPREVIDRVKVAMKGLEAALPKGVRIVPFYDRTVLVDETMGTLKSALTEELIVTVVVVFLFLFNLRASFIVAVGLPIGVLMAFIAMGFLDVGANIMSLAGIAIAIGTMVDIGIVVTQNVLEAIERHPDEPRPTVVADAVAEVAPAIITAVTTTVISFLPVFFLTGQAGRLFKPLAWTKTLALLGALFVGVFILPALCRLFLKPRTGPRPDRIERTYGPTLGWILANKARFAILPMVILVFGLLQLGGARLFLSPFHGLASALGGNLERVEPFHRLEEAFPPIGEAFMPALDEGSLLAMPSLLHQASLTSTLDTMRRMNERMMEVPEVSHVMGKLGRADTALDPAPVGMIETVVGLKPRSEWREGVDKHAIIAELRRKTAILGVSPSWLQPIETRVVMLQSGLRAPMAVAISGAPLDPAGKPMSDADAHSAIERLSQELEQVVATVPGVKDPSALRLGGKPYLEVTVDREGAGRHGVKVSDVLEVLEVAVGGRNLTWTLEGRERYPVRVQIARELRDTPEKLSRLTVRTPSGNTVPLSRLVDIREVVGPASIRTTNGQLRGYVMFDSLGSDEATVMERVMAAVVAWRADKTVAGADPVPLGLRLEPAGRYLEKIAADDRLMLIVPTVLFINLLLLYFAFQSVGLAVAIFSAIPITFAGGFIGLWAWPLIAGGDPVPLTTAVWVGFIALFGIAVDDGAVMATYLKQSFARLNPSTVSEIRAAVIEAGKRRIRPCLMTTATTIVALLPVLWSDGRGADVMQPMALPLIGGMLAELVSLFVVPTMYCWFQERALLRNGAPGQQFAASSSP